MLELLPEVLWPLNRAAPRQGGLQMDCRCPSQTEFWDPLSSSTCSPRRSRSHWRTCSTVSDTAPFRSSATTHSSCRLSLWILQVCCPLEYCQVYGWVLPRVWPSRQGREAFLVSSLLLQARPGPSQLPDQEGSSKTPGKSWAVKVLPV